MPSEPYKPVSPTTADLPWMVRVGAWIAAYNPLGMGFVGHKLMARQLAIWSHGLPEDDVEDILRSATPQAIKDRSACNHGR